METDLSSFVAEHMIQDGELGSLRSFPSTSDVTGNFNSRKQQSRTSIKPLLQSRHVIEAAMPKVGVVTLQIMRSIGLQADA